MQKSWDGYITALGKLSIPSSTIDGGLPFPNSGGPLSGFQEFKVLEKNKETQKKYDAMFREWEGIEASNKATSLYKPEFMPVNR